MKNPVLLISAITLSITPSAFAAITCQSLPSCADLGYVDKVVDCPTDINGNSAVLKCPFDGTMGKCMREATVGQIGYFKVLPNANSGWLLCDGTSKSRSKYPELAAYLDATFCNSPYHLNTACSSSAGTFAVPDYRGYFLRGMGAATNSNFSSYSGYANTSNVIPQREALPNLKGNFGINQSTHGDRIDSETGLFGDEVLTYNVDKVEKGSCDKNAMHFNANRYNPVYTNNGHVIPANYAVYAYIYAGKVIK